MFGEGYLHDDIRTTLEENGRTINDIVWIGSKDGEYAITWDEIVKMNIYCDLNFAIPEDLIVVGKDWWLEKHEVGYGCKGFNFIYHEVPQIKPVTKPITRLEMHDKFGSKIKNVQKNYHVALYSIIDIQEKFFFGKCNAKEIEEWDIPKGQAETNERCIDAALRELKEETGLRISQLDLQILGSWDLTDTKNVQIYYAKTFGEIPEEEKYYSNLNELPTTDSLKCESLFNHKTLGAIPELETFCYMTLKDARPIIPDELYNVLLYAEKDIAEYLNDYELKSKISKEQDAYYEEMWNH